VNVDKNSRQAEREERALMPRSAPRPDGGEDTREIATLEAQLRALEQDIHTARRRSNEAPGIGSMLGGHRDSAPPKPRGEQVRLRDGTEIVIRPIEPEDADQLRAGFEHLAAVSRYRRFLGEIHGLTRHQLDYLTHVDHVDHEALAALVAATGAGIGTARYVRDANDPTQAEVAVVVGDDWQGRGVGTELLARLARRARANGIERLTARMIVGNDIAHRLLAGIGDVIDERRLPGAIELTLRLS
jgi:RimJ/RimL family protein N-acetyltransferase